MTTRARRAADFIAAHPGCRVSEVAAHLDTDMAGAWEALVDATRLGLIRRDKRNDLAWRFYPEED